RPEPPRNLRVFNATISTLTVKWDAAPGPVKNYKVMYKPIAGGEPLSVSVSSVLLGLEGSLLVAEGWY
ncbi:hypothetical protein GOODEAATRI_033747, partial [Goodea atripinnis]